MTTQMTEESATCSPRSISGQGEDHDRRVDGGDEDPGHDHDHGESRVGGDARLPPAPGRSVVGSLFIVGPVGLCAIAPALLRPHGRFGRRRGRTYCW